MRWAALAPAACALAAAALVVSPAAAQPVRPNVLVVFDTSTSMNQINDQGQASDGSPLCGGVGDGSNLNDPADAVRRTFSLKKALRETLTQVGTDEANLGLARFPQLEDPALTPACPTGHYYNSAATAVGGKFGCRISSQSQDQTSYGPWFDTNLREFLLVDVTRKPAAGKPLAADFDPRGGNVAEIHRWLDQGEAAAGGVITDPELRAGGTTNLTHTPLGRSLFYARLYFEGYVKPADPRAACRKNIVVLVTDGAETCDMAPSALNPFAQAALLYAAGVEVFVVTDTATGSANDNIAYFGSGGARAQATRVTLTDSSAVRAALVKIIAEAVPPAEICNGLDDNCNGKVDEEPLPGVGSQCLCDGLTAEQVGRGRCARGATVCRGAAGIKCEGCVLPATEICNGVDDNCDGRVDEGFMLGQPCDNGLSGACKRTGLTICKTDGTGVTCDAPAVQGTAEVCNGVDDDCNGMIDDGSIPGSGEACGIGLGVCKAGRTVCQGGRFVCSEMTQPGSKETCNGLDDNCNGLVDEEIAGVGEVCACAPHTLRTLMTGECRPGRTACKGREPLDCEGCVLPRGEICDGKDNNCDGQVDEDNPCPGGFLCLEGRCQVACKDGEFPCPTGYQCDRPRNVCISLKCAGVVCPDGWSCNEGDGMCKDLCAGVSCAAPRRCRSGLCLDCYTLGCPPGQLCQNGECRESPCANKTCEAGQLCDETGACVGTCPGGCPTGERCLRGACRKDPCAGVSCDLDYFCNPETGGCERNPCAIKTCPQGQVCVPTTGQCRDDPCASARCPAGRCVRCQVSADGLPVCADDPKCADRVAKLRVTTGGGGCSCALGGRGGEQTAVLLLALCGTAVSLVRRRRRRRG